MTWLGLLRPGVWASSVLAVVCGSVVLSVRLAAGAPISSWITNGPPQANVLSIAIDPRTPTTIYAGAERGQIFKSTDSGMHWRALETGALRGAAHTLLMTADATAIYVGADNGVFVSTHAGDDWTPAGLDATVVNALVIDPNAPLTLYAGVGGGGGDHGVFRGTIGSTQWTRAGSGLPESTVHAIATDPLEPEHTFPTALFAVTDDGLFRTVDHAVSWEAVNSGLPEVAVNVILTHPNNLFTLYVGTDTGVFVSNDIGLTWQATDDSFTSAVSSLLVDPSSGDLYAGTLGDGVFASTDGGANWIAFNNGLTNGMVHVVARAPGSPLTLFAGSADGVFLTPTTAALCMGDCDGSGAVTVNEIIVMVNIALGNAAVSTCAAADPNHAGMVVITQIIAAVRNALNTCLPG